MVELQFDEATHDVLDRQVTLLNVLGRLAWHSYRDVGHLSEGGEVQGKRHVVT